MASRDLKYEHPRNNREDISLIWFNDNLPSLEECMDFENDLRTINDYVLFFSDKTSLMNYIDSVRQETIVLILYIKFQDAETFPNFMNSLKDKRQISSIILFCTNTHLVFDHDWKIASICDRKENMLEELKRQIQKLQQQLANTVADDNISQKFIRELVKESPSYLYLHLFKDIVMATDNIPAAKQVMLEYCRAYYAGNKFQLNQIDKFDRTYQSTDAIQWYTKDSFVYRLINKALRTEDVEQLYIFRFYIADLCSHLRALKQEQQKKYNQGPCISHCMTVYRGIVTSLQCIETLRNNINRIVSFNGFLSTSQEENVARTFASVGSMLSNDCDQHIILYINVNMDLPNIIASVISHISSHRDEHEVLFDIGTTFLVKDLVYDKNFSMWRCELEATEDGAMLVLEHVKFYASEMQGASSDIRLAGLLIDMCQYEKAKSCLQKLLVSGDRLDKAHIHFQLGRITHCQKSHQQAMQHLHIARLLEKNPLNIARIMMKIGLKLFQQSDDIDGDNYREGIHWNKLAFKMYCACGHIDSFDGAYCLNNIGFGLHKLGDYSKALTFHKRALKIRQRILPKDHSFVAQSFRNIGLAYLELDDCNKAIWYQMRALDIVNRTVPEMHWSRANTLQNLGVIYHRKNDYQNAQKQFELALNIYEHTFEHDHKDVIRARLMLECANNGSPLPL